MRTRVALCLSLLACGPGTDGVNVTATTSHTAALTYDAFPPELASTAPPRPLAAGEFQQGFESFTTDGDLDCSSWNQYYSSFDTTSGCLASKTLVGTSGTIYRRGQFKPHSTSSYNKTRTVAFVNDNTGRLRLTDQAWQARFYISAFGPVEDNQAANQGLSMFARYRTEDNLYVASVKYDGRLWIKRVSANVYTTLCSKPAGTVSLRKGDGWYRFTFSATTQATGVALTASVYDEKTGVTSVVSCTDSSTARHTSGTGGFRTDYVDGYVDDWRSVTY